MIRHHRSLRRHSPQRRSQPGPDILATHLPILTGGRLCLTSHNPLPFINPNRLQLRGREDCEDLCPKESWSHSHYHPHSGLHRLTSSTSLWRP